MSYSNKSDSDIINRNNDSDLPFSGLKDINTSDILDPTAVIKEDLIHTKSKLQRTNNRLQSTSKELRRINDMKNSTAKLYNELLMEHKLLKFNEDKAREYGRVIQNRWWEELWLRIDAERYPAAILHYCNDHVLLVLNEFHSHKKTECWILKF